MLRFTSLRAEKVLNAYALKGQIFKEEIYTLKDLKKIRIDGNKMVLALPVYTEKKNAARQVKHFLTFIY